MPWRTWRHWNRKGSIWRLYKFWNRNSQCRPRPSWRKRRKSWIRSDRFNSDQQSRILIIRTSMNLIPSVRNKLCAVCPWSGWSISINNRSLHTKTTWEVSLGSLGRFGGSFSSNTLLSGPGSSSPKLSKKYTCQRYGKCWGSTKFLHSSKNSSPSQ